MSGRHGVSDTLVLAERNLLRIPRAPDLLLAFTVQPIMFVLLFAYVFGGAISDARLRLRRLPDPRDHRPDDGLRRLRHRAGAQRGPAQGPDRPLPLAADVARRGARRAHPRRRRHQRALDHDPARRRRDHRLLLQTPRPARRRRDRPAAALRLRLLLGLRLHRPLLLLARGGQLLGFIAVFPLTFVSSAFVPVGSMPAACASSPKSTPSRSPSTRCAPSASARPPATASGARSSGRWRSSPSSGRWPSRAIGGLPGGSGRRLTISPIDVHGVTVAPAPPTGS